MAFDSLLLQAAEEGLLLEDHRKVNRPNKAPEPTPGSVTPRAFSRISDMKPQTPLRHAARGAPAPVVAHL